MKKWCSEIRDYCNTKRGIVWCRDIIIITILLWNKIVSYNTFLRQTKTNQLNYSILSKQICLDVFHLTREKWCSSSSTFLCRQKDRPLAAWAWADCRSSTPGRWSGWKGRSSFPDWLAAASTKHRCRSRVRPPAGCWSNLRVKMIFFDSFSNYGIKCWLLKLYPESIKSTYFVQWCS